MKEHRATLFADDFLLLEAPRWHQGRLWVSDVFEQKLYFLGPDGSRTHLSEAPQRPGGSAFSSGGTPNVASTNGGRTLVTAEMWSHRLTAFDRAPDGSRSNARIFAELPGREPDGICADAEGAIWVACFNTGEAVRVLEGGEITDRVRCGRHAIACQLGGDDGRTLFCTAYTGTVEDMDAGKRLAVIYAARVAVPAAAFVRAAESVA